MLALQALTPELLAAAIPEATLDEARRIVGAVHRGGGVPPSVRNVRRGVLERVRARGSVPELQVLEAPRDAADGFVKYALAAGTEVVETVRIPLERAGRFSVCVSSQAGCALACAFCATGRLGLRRNLDAWEILEQVRVVRRGLDRAAGERVHGIVFQGMGEPLANLDAVLAAIRVASEPAALAVDGRNITVCTAGIPAGIRRLAREAPKVRLGISIGGARPEVRRPLMPVDRLHPLDEVLAAAVEHARETGLAPMWAVTLLDGRNDSDGDARALARLAAEFTAQAGVRPRLSIIAYNAIDAPERDPFHRADPGREAAFRAILHAAGFASHRRYSGGAAIRAACGQLAAAGRAPRRTQGPTTAGTA
jgi:23S rRNA (adenine2503-C2)-methyltransferase